VIHVPPLVRFETTQPKITACSTWGLGYYPENSTAVSTTVIVDDVIALQASILGSMSVVNTNAADATNGLLLAPGLTGMRKLTVPKKVLCSTPTKMFRTNLTASFEDLEIDQGQLFFSISDSAGANTVTLYAQIEYEVCFFGQVDSTSITSSLNPRAGATVTASDSKDAHVSDFVSDSEPPLSDFAEVEVVIPGVSPELVDKARFVAWLASSDPPGGKNAPLKKGSKAPTP